MKEFNYKDYLKNNPLLGEGHEGGGIPDSDIESDHEHQWEDIGDNEEECKICGLKRSITSEMEREIKMVLENCACLGRDAYGEYIDKMTKYIMDLIEENKDGSK